MNLDLDDRSVLVTGGSRGIGQAIVYAYAAERARVTFTYNSNSEAAMATVQGVEATGGRAAAVEMDLSDTSSIERAIEEAIAWSGGLDVLVANAVRWPTDAAAPLTDADWNVWKRGLRANLEGTAATVRAAWPHLSRSQNGRVVLISTGVARRGMAGATAYAAAKSGLEGLVAALKWEGAPTGILCNVVAPGFTVTEENLANFPDEVRQEVRAATPSGRLSEPSDIAPMVVFLGSPMNTNITGGYLPIDGGKD